MNTKLKGLRKYTLCLTGMVLAFAALSIGKIDAETFQFIVVGALGSFAGADVADHFRAGLEDRSASGKKEQKSEPDA